jgi:N-acetyl-alpha-D-muramate 1-phosphate uridylyltransferase
VSECVILAGGLASRLGTQAGDLPKTLLPVAGRPFADHQLTWLAEQGVGDVVYCIGYRGDQIRDYVGGGERWGLNVTYVDEGADLRGTGGALRLAYDAAVLAESYAVLYGDSYLDVNLPRVHEAFRASGQPALMTVLRNEGRWDKSNADFDGALVTRYSKTEGDFEWIDYGLSILTRDIASEIPNDEPEDLAKLFTRLSRERRLAGFEVTERFYEIGSPNGLAELERFLGTA